MHRVSPAINWSAAARYMTSNNYRKWNLVEGRGWSACDQLVDSDVATVPIYTYIIYMYIDIRDYDGAVDETPNLHSGEQRKIRERLDGR